MAELDWIEERWWHRGLKVSGCLAALLGAALAGLICHAFIGLKHTHVTWQKPPPPGVMVTPCFEQAPGASWRGLRCNAPGPYDVADRLHEAGEITAEERVEIHGLELRPAVERLKRLGRERRFGYWVEDTITPRELAASIAITLATLTVLWLAMRLGYLLVLRIAHGHARVRPRARR